MHTFLISQISKAHLGTKYAYTEEKTLRIVGVAMQVAGLTQSLHFIVLTISDS